MPGGTRENQELEKKIEDALFNKIKKLIDTTIAPLVTRIKELESSQPDSVKIKALETTLALQDKKVQWLRDNDKRSVPLMKAEMDKTFTTLIHATVAKMETRLAKAEVLEARLKGMETMIRSIEQSIDMLQRKR
jgi:hypothetical protein